MYKARLTTAGATRRGIAASDPHEFEYSTIHPSGEVVTGCVYQGESIGWTAGFIGYPELGDEASCELITWPDDFDYKMFPESITVNVTQEDLDSGGRRGERPDGIYLALKRDYPDFEPRINDPWGGITLVKDGRTAFYPSTPEYVTLINEIDVTGGKPKPATFEMNLQGGTAVQLAPPAFEPSNWGPPGFAKNRERRRPGRYSK